MQVEEMRTERTPLFRDIVPCLLDVAFLMDLTTFFFGDGYPSFGPQGPPAGPRAFLLLDFALSQTIPASDRFPVSVQPCLDRNSSNSRGSELH